MRADQALVACGLAASRSQAQRLIAAGVHWRLPGGNWQAVRKSGDELPPQAELQLQDAAEARYVSRGGLKLQGALAATGLAVQGWRCLDVGQSTGGFTDCLLQHGAASVTGVDVGHGQLHPRLALDARVRCIERINARHLDAHVFIAENPLQTCEHPVSEPLFPSASTPAAPAAGPAPLAPAAQPPLAAAFIAPSAGPPAAPCAAPPAAAFAPPFDLIVGDLSFISLTLVLPALAPLLGAGGQVLLLVKPQFELQPQHIGKGGIVRNPALYAQVQQRLQATCAAAGLAVQHWLPSPIAGGDGNREFFIHASAPPRPPAAQATQAAQAGRAGHQAH